MRRVRLEVLTRPVARSGPTVGDLLAVPLLDTTRLLSFQQVCARRLSRPVTPGCGDICGLVVPFTSTTIMGWEGWERQQPSSSKRALRTFTIWVRPSWLTGVVAKCYPSPRNSSGRLWLMPGYRANTTASQGSGVATATEANSSGLIPRISFLELAGTVANGPAPLPGDRRYAQGGRRMNNSTGWTITYIVLLAAVLAAVVGCRNATGAPGGNGETEPNVPMEGIRPNPLVDKGSRAAPHDVDRQTRAASPEFARISPAAYGQKVRGRPRHSRRHVEVLIHCKTHRPYTLISLQ